MFLFEFNCEETMINDLSPQMAIYHFKYDYCNWTNVLIFR